MEVKEVLKYVKSASDKELRLIERTAKRARTFLKKKTDWLAKPITLNLEQGVYVVPCWHDAPGYTCLGFDVCEEQTVKYSEWLHSLGYLIHGPVPRKPSVEAYDYHKFVCDMVFKVHMQTGKRCWAELTPQLIDLEGCRVEVVDKYGERRRFTVGRSSGWIPVHLEIQPQEFYKGKWTSPEGDGSGGGTVTGAPFKSVTRVNNMKGR